MLPSAPLDVAAVPLSGRTVTTLAGNANELSNPTSLTLDSAGNVYVADFGSNSIRKVTPAGAVTTVAGSGLAVHADGTGAAAGFIHPNAIGMGADGTLYVGDGDGYVRIITGDGVVTTITQRATTESSMHGAGAVRGIAVDGSTLYISDRTGILKFKPFAGWATFVGFWLPGNMDGTGTEAYFNNPTSLAIDGAKNLYVSDDNNGRIRKVTPAGVVTTFAGGRGGVAVDAAGNVFVGDDDFGRIGMLTPSGVLTSLAGSTAGYADGPADLARFNGVTGLALDAAGTLYIADSKNNRIRKLTAGGAGVLLVSWSVPSAPGSSPISGYTASAVAAGQPTKTCIAATTTCTLSGLTSGVVYTVSVTATNGAGTSTPSISMGAKPN